MKTVENDRKNTYIGFGLFYNNGTKTKMLRSVYGVEIIGHSKTKESKRKYVENDRNMIKLSVIDKRNNKLNYLIQTLIYINFIVVKH
jgi:hypothetical protein